MKLDDKNYMCIKLSVFVCGFFIIVQFCSKYFVFNMEQIKNDKTNLKIELL